jgi:arylformamidase
MPTGAAGGGAYATERDLKPMPASFDNKGRVPAAPRVWLDLDQKALDDAYDQTVYAPNFAQINRRREINSAAIRERLGAPRRMAYGQTSIEQLDIYGSARRAGPILVLIHGGAWRTGLARDFADGIEPIVRAGGHCVIPDFINVIDAGGSLFPMADQVRRAIAWVARNADVFGGDASRIYLFGRSSGSHLAATALITDWAAYGLARDPVRGAVLSSGMYDLKPVRLSKRSEYVKFTDAMEEELSPQRHLTRINCPVVVAYGTCETPEFQRQARDFAHALQAAGKSVRLIEGAGYNHFELPETLSNPYGLLGRATLELMQLADGNA